METTTATIEKKNWISKLKEKWGVDSGLQVVLILITFSLAGTTAVSLRKLFFGLIGIDAQTPFWIKTIAYILFLFPTYQVLLLGYGTLLGQFKFFWSKERKMLLAIKRIFVK